MRWSYSNTGNVTKDISGCFSKIKNHFSNLHMVSDRELECIYKDYIRIIFGDCIIGNEDRKLRNIAIIYNENNKEYRLSPAFDNALAFHSFNFNSYNSVCFIGNQHFDSKDVIQYIIKYYYDDIEDIIEKFKVFMENDLNQFLTKYFNILPSDKIKYIKEFLESIYKFIKQNINNKKLK